MRYIQIISFKLSIAVRNRASSQASFEFINTCLCEKLSSFSPDTLIWMVQR